MKNDPDYARGKRGPAATPGRRAWEYILEVRRLSLCLEKYLRTMLIDGDEKNHCLAQLDSATCYAEALIARYERTGPPETQSEVADMEAAIRLAQKYPDQFKAIDIISMKKFVADQKKGKVAA